ncbi:MAG: hypothetical protein ACJ71K_20825 [Nitrososphaeraceae archaeon]|jgi:hypothetical protein
MLDSSFFENQVWSALHKAWKGYVIAKNKDEHDKMERYARIIQESQYDLGLEVSSFDNIGMPASSFLWQIVQKDDNNNQEQEVSNENYQTDRQYEQDSLTRIAKILEIIMIMLIGLRMTMPIVKILQIS